jgi:hypothetical protein
MIQRVVKEREHPKCYAFLPEIHETLLAMARAKDEPRNVREQLARGLEGYVLEDFSFSESDIGGELLELSEAFCGGEPGTPCRNEIRCRDKFCRRFYGTTIVAR